MNQNHKFIRTLLRRAGREQYGIIAKQAKLTPTETECLNQFILNNKTQMEIAAQINLSDRSVRIYLLKAYEKIADCRFIANSLTDAETNPCYATSIGGNENDVYESESESTAGNPGPAVCRAMVIGK